MKVLEIRRPPYWPLLIAGGAFAALAIYAACTGDIYIPGRRGTPSRHVLQAMQPEQFRFQLRFDVCAAGIFIFLGVVRLVPIENGIRDLRARWNAGIKSRGLDSKPSPWWGYAILITALALVIWIGKLVMFSD